MKCVDCGKHGWNTSVVNSIIEWRCSDCGTPSEAPPDHLSPEPRPIVVIESPFAGDLDRNARYLDACLSDSLHRGESPFASHGLYTRPGVLRDSEPAERELGIQAGFAFRRVAARTAVYTDLGISSGMQRGIDDALQTGGTVEYRTLGGEWSR